MMRSVIATCASMALAIGLPGVAAPAKPRPAVLDGIWESACLPIGKNGRHGFIVRLTITRKTLDASSQTYAHNSCDIPTVRIDYRATIAARRASADSIDFDHVVAGVTMTVNDQSALAIYNADGPTAGCSMGGGWQLNVPRSIEGRTCPPMTLPVAGTRLYERAWLSDGQLRIGSFPMVWNNVSPDKRPTQPGLLVLKRVTG